MRKRMNRLLPLLAALAFSVSGCTAPPQTQTPPVSTETTADADAPTERDTEQETEPEEKDEREAGKQAQNKEESKEPLSIPKPDGEQAYIVVNQNVPDFTQEDLTTEPFEIFSELDALGRCGAAYANVCKELQPTEPRGEIGMIKPTGWHTVKYPGLVEGNYLYNRCHLLGYQLTGENANEKNLITGTRYMNTIGMLPFEDMVDDYLERHPDNHVLYRVTPVFTGDNLLADGVRMEAMSVEDHGEGVSFHVFCYNIQPGLHIDYEDGESHLEEATEEPELQETDSASENTYAAPGQGERKEIHAGTTYILNTSSGKFHYPSCSSVTEMATTNMEESTQAREALISQGYSPCGRCNP